MGGACGRNRAERRGPLPSRFCARQGDARRRADRRCVPPLCGGQCAAAEEPALRAAARSPRPSTAVSRAFTAEAFAERPGGCAARDPIFIVGMPRAGSTLVEQILSSHSLVEGTSELPDMPALARKTGTLSRRRPTRVGGRAARARRGISQARRRAAPDRPAVLHRQAAQQLAVRAVHPADPAQRKDHRRAAPSAWLLLFELPPAFRARSGVHLRPDGRRPLLCRLCAADGACRRCPARAKSIA